MSFTASMSRCSSPARRAPPWACRTRRASPRTPSCRQDHRLAHTAAAVERVDAHVRQRCSGRLAHVRGAGTHLGGCLAEVELGGSTGDIGRLGGHLHHAVALCMRAVWLSAPLEETSCSGDSRQTFARGARQDVSNDERGGGEVPTRPEVAFWSARPGQGDGRYGMVMPGRPKGRPPERRSQHFAFSLSGRFRELCGSPRRVWKAAWRAVRKRAN